MYKIDLSNPVSRYKNNPVLTSKEVNNVWTDPKLQVITVHNAGITEYNGEVIMLFRSHLRNGISILGIARSKKTTTARNGETAGRNKTPTSPGK